MVCFFSSGKVLELGVDKTRRFGVKLGVKGFDLGASPIPEIEFGFTGYERVLREAISP